MTTESGYGEHGRELMKFLDAYMEARGVAPSTWARDNGISPATFTRWRNGELEPTIAAMESIAPLVGCSVADLLVAARYAGANALGVKPLLIDEPPSVEDAIRRDQTLSRESKAALLTVLAGLRGGGWDGHERRIRVDTDVK